jgi:very-short-patch-repair endonuclease
VLHGNTDYWEPIALKYQPKILELNLREASPSRFQKQIETHLRKIYPNDELLFESMIDEFYMVDAVLPARKLIVEVNGPSHYNAMGQLSQRQRIKQKVLEKLGYTVCQVPASFMNRAAASEDKFK